LILEGGLFFSVLCKTSEWMTAVQRFDKRVKKNFCMCAPKGCPPKIAETQIQTQTFYTHAEMVEIVKTNKKRGRLLL